MTFWELAGLELEEFRTGITSKAKFGENLIMTCMEIGPGLEDKGHTHPFDQCGIVLNGEIEMFIGEERKRLYSNEVYFIHAGESHGWKTYEDAVRLLDVSSKPKLK